MMRALAVLLLAATMWYGAAQVDGCTLTAHVLGATCADQ